MSQTQYTGHARGTVRANSESAGAISGKQADWGDSCLPLAHGPKRLQDNKPFATIRTIQQVPIFLLLMSSQIGFRAVQLPLAIPVAASVAVVVLENQGRHHPQKHSPTTCIFSSLADTSKEKPNGGGR